MITAGTGANLNGAPNSINNLAANTSGNVTVNAANPLDMVPSSRRRYQYWWRFKYEPCGCLQTQSAVVAGTATINTGAAEINLINLNNNFNAINFTNDGQNISVRDINAIDIAGISMTGNTDLSIPQVVISLILER